MKIACYAAGSVGTNNYVISDDNGITAIIDCDGSPGSVNEVAAHFGCKIVGAAKEMPVFTDPALNCSQFVGGPIIVHPDILVSEGDKVTVGDMEFDVMETPGHTVGSICFIGKDIIFSGDTLFAGSCGRVDLPGGSAADMQRSLALVADLPLPDETTVYPGHESFTTLGQERRSNPYLMGEVF